MATLNLGQIRPVSRGVWDSTKNYNSYDFVTYNGSAYLALQNVLPNYEPDSHLDFWVLFGAKGSDGINGIDGALGIDGAKGEQGIQGLQGEQGIQGEKGEQGQIGVAGLQGEQGIQGIQGEKGDRGDTGENGNTGIQGLQGEQGEQGPPAPLSDAIDLDRSDIAASSKAVSLVNTKASTTQDSLDNHNDDADAHNGKLDFFPAGTTMNFVQSAAPPNWVKQTDAKYENAALRFTIGDATTGGSVAFSTAFRNQSMSVSVNGSVGGATLSTSQIANHQHGIRTNFTQSSYTDVSNYGGGGSSNTKTAYTNSTGGAGAHTHSLSGASGSASINLGVKYVDCIVAKKA